MENPIIERKVLAITPFSAEVFAEDVFKDLRQVYPFGSGQIITDGLTEKAVLTAGLSDRQKVRAVDVLGQGAGFWDRVGNRVIIPLACKEDDADASILAVFHDTAFPAMSPDEAERWLPVLQQLVHEKFSLKQREYAVSHGGDVPPMVCGMVFYMLRRGRVKDVSVIRFNLSSAGLKDIKRSVDFIEKGFLKNSGFGSLWIAGAGHDCLWCVATDIAEKRLSVLFKGSELPGILKRHGIKGITGTALSPGVDREEICRRISETERTACLLGSSFFTSYDLEELEQKTGLFNLSDLHAKVRERTFGKRRSLVILSAGVTDLASKYISDVIPGGHERTLLILKQSPAPFSQPSDDWAVDVLKKEILGQVPFDDAGSVNAGVASTWQPGIGSGKLFISGLWAFLHSIMLGKGETVVHDHVTWQLRGDEFSAWNDYKNACVSYRRGLALDPDNPEILNSLGAALATLGRYAEAVTCFKKAIKISKADYMLFYNLSGALLKAGRPDEAAEAASRALALAPDNIVCLYRRAESLLACGKTGEAVSLMEGFLESRGDENLFLTRLLARALIKSGSWPDAKIRLEKIIAVKADDKEVLKMLGEGYLRFENDSETARRFLGSALKV